MLHVFWGGTIHVRRCGKIKRTHRLKLPKRTLNNSVALLIPFTEKIEALRKMGYPAVMF